MMPVGPCAASRAWAGARSSETGVAEPCLALTFQGLSSKMGTPAAPLRCSEHRQWRWALPPGQQVQCLATEWAATPNGQEAVSWWRNWRYRLARGTVHLWEVRDAKDLGWAPEGLDNSLWQANIFTQSRSFCLALPWDPGHGTPAIAGASQPCSAVSQPQCSLSGSESEEPELRPTAALLNQSVC